MKINEYLKKNWIYILLIVIAFTAGIFSFRSGDHTENPEYRESLDSITERNRLTYGELRAAGQNISGLEYQLREADRAIKNLESTNIITENLLREQRELYDDLKQYYTETAGHAGAAGAGIEEALKGLDDLIQEIQNSGDGQ